MIKVCAECGQEFDGRANAAFCTTAHKRTFWNRCIKRGQVLLPLAQTWRGQDGRRKGDDVKLSAYARKEVCALIDRWNAEDRAAGRRPDLIAGAKMEAGWLACDL